MLFIRKLIPQTLFARFLLIITVPTLVGQMLIIFLFYDRHWYNVSYYTSNLIANEIKSLIDNYSSSDYSLHSSTKDYLNLSYQLHPTLKAPQKQPKLTEELEIFKNILNLKIGKNNIIRLNEEGKIEVWAKLSNDWIRITFSSKLLMNPTTYIFVLWLVFLTILLLSISIIFLRNQIKSILALANAARDFGRGVKGSETSYKPTGAKEIRKTGIAFIKMKERIERQIAKRTQMLAMISHDLRTPLTRMSLQLELMKDCEEKKMLQQDIITMKQMIDSYLDFARGEGGEEFQWVCISSWMVELLARKWDGQSITIKVTDKNIKAQIKPLAFERAITNIVNNAIQYSNKKIVISIYSAKHSTIIDIEDDGIGIKDEEKELVFKPFYRSNKSRSLNNTGNVGLGLAIVKEIIVGHYASISLKDSLNLGGLLVTITLPTLKFNN